LGVYLIYLLSFYVRVDEMGGEYSTYGKDKNAYTILVGEPVWEGPFGTIRRRRENNIRKDLREIG
jgi:hypothetical protein